MINQKQSETEKYFKAKNQANAVGGFVLLVGVVGWACTGSGYWMFWYFAPIQWVINLVGG